MSTYTINKIKAIEIVSHIGPDFYNKVVAEDILAFVSYLKHEAYVEELKPYRLITLTDRELMRKIIIDKDPVLVAEEQAAREQLQTIRDSVVYHLAIGSSPEFRNVKYKAELEDKLLS